MKPLQPPPMPLRLRSPRLSGNSTLGFTFTSPLRISAPCALIPQQPSTPPRQLPRCASSTRRACTTRVPMATPMWWWRPPRHALSLWRAQGARTRGGPRLPTFSGRRAPGAPPPALPLAGGGASVQDVAKLTVLVVDHTEQRLALFSQAVRSLWPDGAAPACTLIPVPRLALDGMLIEIEATAVMQA